MDKECGEGHEGQDDASAYGAADDGADGGLFASRCGWLRSKQVRGGRGGGGGGGWGESHGDSQWPSVAQRGGREALSRAAMLRHDGSPIIEEPPVTLLGRAGGTFRDSVIGGARAVGTERGHGGRRDACCGDCAGGGSRRVAAAEHAEVGVCCAVVFGVGAAHGRCWEGQY